MTYCATALFCKYIQAIHLTYFPCFLFFFAGIRAEWKEDQRTCLCDISPFWPNFPVCTSINQRHQRNAANSFLTATNTRHIRCVFQQLYINLLLHLLSNRLCLWADAVTLPGGSTWPIFSHGCCVADPQASGLLQSNQLTNILYDKMLEEKEIYFTKKEDISCWSAITFQILLLCTIWSCSFNLLNPWCMFTLTHYDT